LRHGKKVGTKREPITVPNSCQKLGVGANLAHAGFGFVSEFPWHHFTINQQ
jgi:hypothetical protein